MKIFVETFLINLKISVALWISGKKNVSLQGFSTLLCLD